MLYEPFSEKYGEILNHPETNPPISWSIGTFFLNLFMKKYEAELN
jgi:hypothetical protein